MQEPKPPSSVEWSPRVELVETPSSSVELVETPSYPGNTPRPPLSVTQGSEDETNARNFGHTAHIDPRVGVSFRAEVATQGENPPCA
jgi:hypothetical protein